MSVSTEIQSGLEGVVAFATEIAEPDRAGGALRYRGVNIEELVGKCRSSRSGACSSTARSLPGLPAAEPHPLSVHSGDPRVDVSPRSRCSRRSGASGADRHLRRGSA